MKANINPEAPYSVQRLVALLLLPAKSATQSQLTHCTTCDQQPICDNMWLPVVRLFSPSCSLQITVSLYAQTKVAH